MSINIPFLGSSRYDENVECITGLKSSIKDNDNILLVGNGFDLALGKRTKYQDFLLYLFVICLLKNIKFDGDNDEYSFIAELNNFLKSQDNANQDIINVIDIVEKRLDLDDDFSFSWLIKNVKGSSFLELLIKVIFQNVSLNSYLRPIENNGTNFPSIKITHFDFAFPSIKDKCNPSSPDLNIVTNFSDTSIEELCSCICKFYDDLSSEIQKNKLYGWLDIEAFIEYLVLNDRLLDNRFVISKAFRENLDKNSFSNGLYSDIKGADEIYRSLHLFTIEFCRFVSLQESLNNKIDLTTKFEEETSKYMLSVDSCANREGITCAKYRLDKVITSIIDFNYSNTSQSVIHYNFRTNKHLDVYHVNGRCDNLSAVFSYTNTKQIKVNREAFKFEKRTQRLLKNVPSVDFVKLTSTPFNLFIFGHSCSTADRDILEPLLKSKSLQFVIVFCYSEEDKISIYKNLCEILGYEHMDHLTRKTDSTSQRLLWAIHEDNSTDKS